MIHAILTVNNSGGKGPFLKMYYLGSLCAVYLMIYSGEMKGKRERGERREMSECSNKHLLLK